MLATIATLLAFDIKIRIPWMEALGDRMLKANVPERFADVLGLAGVVLIAFGALVAVALVIVIIRGLK
jgi:hypothetical protein